MTPMTVPAGPATDLELVHLSADDLMTRDVATVSTTTTVGQAIASMRVLGVRHLPVLGDGRFVGIVDDRLVALSLLAGGGLDEALEQPVSTAMTHYVPQVAPAATLQRVAHLLTTSSCDAIVVIDAQDHLLGIITMVDVVGAVALSNADLPRPPLAVGEPPYPAAVAGDDPDDETTVDP